MHRGKFTNVQKWKARSCYGSWRSKRKSEHQKYYFSQFGLASSYRPLHSYRLHLKLNKRKNSGENVIAHGWYNQATHRTIWRCGWFVSLLRLVEMDLIDGKRLACKWMSFDTFSKINLIFVTKAFTLSTMMFGSRRARRRYFSEAKRASINGIWWNCGTVDECVWNYKYILSRYMGTLFHWWLPWVAREHCNVHASIYMAWREIFEYMLLCTKQRVAFLSPVVAVRFSVDPLKVSNFNSPNE